MSQLQIRLTQKKDYYELHDWWKWHRWSTPPSLELLDDLKYGIMISHNGQNVCAGFLYFTNAKAFALLEFIVSSYRIKDKKVRGDALKLLIYSLCDIAKKKDIKTLFSSVRHEGLIQHYKDCSFIITYKNSNELILHL